MLRSIARSFKMPKPKVIVIAGTTGVGKSDLSIQIANKVNGEIINSDSMQMYKGLPIITNKHPVEERMGIRHHIMNHVPWDEEYYIHRFEKECMEAIEDIHSRGKIPIIVGGTHYYLQTLFNKRIEKKVRKPTDEEKKLLDSNDSQLVYDSLKKVDSVIAKKFHTNDTRRVKRMLEIFYTTGEKPSVTFGQQDTSLKFDTLFFWIYSEPSVLDVRLDNRVDKMIKGGALEEIKVLYEFYKENNYTMEQCGNGVWQVIGFKEFLPYLENSDECNLTECIDKMKVRTRQYAKRQVKWIKKMLIPDINGKIYVLNATDLMMWDETVSARADAILAEFISGKKIAVPFAEPELCSLLNYNSPNSPKSDMDWKQYTCTFCKDRDDKNLVAIGTRNWEIHLKSRRHRTNVNKQYKKKSYEEWQKDKLSQTDISS
ncbi:unnamed protein product [Kluyveromyces dobzhanskii CBS 2104]|uniref:tRNA dimethylallyltransferase n=1 Tax=Kluyveromyces dobzhanskii CBS 2104 TaxID=1427455 RepID=A0A0A8L4J2_9SACH|nr:unnamed protein product [Kluyveromyces dobzhanskii CBS 2104]